MKQRIYILLALCCPLFVFCQDITGLWKGTMYNDSTNHSLAYEFVITKDNGKYSGFSHTWFLINEKEYYGIKKIKVRIAKDGKVIIQDDELIDNNYPIAPHKNVYQLNVLQLSSLNNETILDGLFVTNPTKKFCELTGRIHVKKADQISQSDLLKYLQKNNIENTVTKLK